MKNHYYVIESHGEEEKRRFSKELRNLNPDTTVYSVRTPEQFTDSLLHISSTVTSDTIPYIYIDTHGTTDAYILLDGELNYEQAAEFFRIVNKACGGKLNIISGTCYGSFLNKTFGPDKFPVCHKLIAANTKILNNDCYDGFIRYAQTLKRGQGLHSAMINFKAVIPESPYKTFEVYHGNKFYDKNSKPSEK